jgi:hypothetical protein
MSIISRDPAEDLIKFCSFKIPATDYADERPLQLFERINETDFAVPLRMWSLFHDEFPEPFFQLFEDTISPLPVLRKEQSLIFQQTIIQLEKIRAVQLILRTGWGKTTLSAHLIKHYGIKPLIITHLRIVRDQWRTILGPGAVVTGTSDFKDEMVGCGLVIVDEMHQCSESIFNLLLKLRPAYLIGLTATPERRDGLSKFFPLFFGDEIKCSDAERITEFNVIKQKMHFRPPFKFRNVKGRKTLDWNFIVNYLSTNEKRQNEVVKIILNQRDIEGTILVFCLRVLEAETIYEKLFEMGEDVYLLIGGSEIPKNFYKFIISTYHKSGTGYNNTDLSVVILNGSRTDVRQFVGRLRGTRKRIIDLVDDCPMIESHWKKREFFYKSEGAIITKIE